MPFTVVQRIGGGFGILLFLLVLVGGAGYISMTHINNNLFEVTDKTTPVVVSSGELVNYLLKANRSVLAYYGSEQVPVLTAFEQEFQHFKMQYQQTHGELQAMIADDETLQLHLGQAQGQVDAFFNQTGQLFAKHKEVLELDNRVQALRAEFDRVVKSMGSQLIRLNTNLDLQWSARFLNDRVVDGLAEVTYLQGMTDIYAINNKIDSLFIIAEDVSRLFERYREIYGDRMNEISPLVERFDASLRDENGLVQVYKAKVIAQAEAKELLQSITDHVDQSSASLREFVGLATDQANTAAVIATTTVRLSLVLIILVSLSAVVIAVVIALWVSQSIRKPLVDVINQLQIIAAGDMTKHLDDRAKDEFGVLSRWVNDLIDRQRVILQKIADSSTELNHAAAAHIGQLAAKGDQEVAESGENLARLVQDQAALIQRFKV